MDQEHINEQRKMIADMLDAGKIDGEHRAAILAMLEDLFAVANKADALQVGVQMMGCQHGRKNKGEIHAVEFTIVLPPSPEHEKDKGGFSNYTVIARGEPPAESKEYGGTRRRRGGPYR